MGIKRPGRWAIRDKRWPALRQQALRRDGYQCVECGSRGRLEVDHIKPVRHHPELAFTLGNLQCMCKSCHTIKTRRELGMPPADPERRKWRALLRARL